MKPLLFVLPGSHPSWAARLMLERKGIDYTRVDLIPAAHRKILRALRFPGLTVPALRIDGQRVQGTRTIAETLDRMRPDPPLLPADPAKRSAVEEVERFADAELQSAARRITWWGLLRDGDAPRTFLDGARVGMPHGVAARIATPFARASARYNNADDEHVRADLAALPGMLDRVDGWIADGTLSAGAPTVADYQVATSVRLLMCSQDLRPRIESRPAGQHSLTVVPDFPGHIGPVLGPVMPA